MTIYKIQLDNSYGTWLILFKINNTEILNPYPEKSKTKSEVKIFSK